LGDRGGEKETGETGDYVAFLVYRGKRGRWALRGHGGKMRGKKSLESSKTRKPALGR